MLNRRRVLLRATAVADLAVGSEPGAVANWSGTPALPARAVLRPVPVPAELRLWAE